MQRMRRGCARILPCASSASSASHDLIAAVIVAGNRVGARRDPAHRPPAAARGPQHQRVFRIGVGLHPNPPPTSGAMTRNLVSGRREHVRRDFRAHRVRRPASWCRACSCRRPGRSRRSRRAAPSHWAARRLFSSRSDTTCAALAKAAAVAFSSPFASVNETLPGHSSHTAGAPGLTASSMRATAGSGS